MNNQSFEERRQHLGSLSDEELKDRFWELAEQIVQPMVDLARTHTTPSIERSVLLRAGISSIEAGKVVELAFEKGVLGFGAGNLVLRLSKRRGLSFMEAGRILAENNGWDEVLDEA